jgi:hypothetical protein
MEQLRNSLEIALYCMARDEARAGYSCRSDDFFDRDKDIFEAGYQDGKNGRSARLPPTHSRM